MTYGRRRGSDVGAFARARVPSNVGLDQSGQFAINPAPAPTAPAATAVINPAVEQAINPTPPPAPTPSQPVKMSVVRPQAATSMGPTSPAFDAPDTSAAPMQTAPSSEALGPLDHVPTTITPETKKAIVTGVIVLAVIGILFYVRRSAAS